MDLFDEALDLDAKAVAKGQEDGRDFARSKAFQDGGSTGVAAGFKTGREMGFMRGATVAILAAMDAGTVEENARSRKTAEVILARIDSLPVDSAGDERLTDQLQLIRVKFRLLVSRAGIVLSTPAGVEKSTVNATF